MLKTLKLHDPALGVPFNKVVYSGIAQGAARSSLEGERYGELRGVPGREWNYRGDSGLSTLRC